MNAPASRTSPSRPPLFLKATGWGDWAAAHPAASLALFYLAVSFVFAGELLLPGRSLYQWDTLLYNWPVLLETRAQLLAGHVPFWASSFCCGTPLLENINAGVLYPLRILCWFLPLRAGYHLFLFAHVWLSFLGMHILVRRGFRQGLLAAVAAALAYGASGYARSMWDTHNFMPLPWIPLGLAALLEARTPGRGLRSLLGAAACWSLMILGGDFQAAVVWLPVAFLLAVLLPQRGRMVSSLLGAVALAILVTAPQWVPAMVASPESYRSGGLLFHEATERSFHPLRLVELLVPHAFGNHSTWFALGLEPAVGRRLLPWNSSFHVGLLTLLAGALAIRRRRNPFVAWSLLLVAGFTTLSFGHHLKGFWLFLQLPVVGGFRYPEKYLLWSTLGLASLCAFGVSGLLALWSSARMRKARLRILGGWAVAVLAGACAAVVIVRTAAGDAGGVDRWLVARLVAVAFVLAAALVAALASRRLNARVVVPALFVLDLLLPWSVERPVTGRFDPLIAPAVAAPILGSDAPGGRFLRDRAVKQLPLPGYFASLPAGEKKAVFYREGLYFNAPRIWGMNTADGFSPLESTAMRTLRTREAAPVEDQPVDTAALAGFCRLAAVEWLMTTPERAGELARLDLRFETAEKWGPAGEVVLLRLKNVTEAQFDAPSTTVGRVRIEDVWRVRPGRIVVRVTPGDAGRLIIRETYARGWRAEDEVGNPLPVSPADRAFIGVDVPSGVRQVRLRYEPLGWRAGLLLGLVGSGATLTIALLALGDRRLRQLGASAGMAVLCSIVLFAALGLLARRHWSCAFDEGFHVTRGVTLKELGDSRLSYFHPPLQNLMGGYFADLALGDRVRLPDNPSWEAGDLTRYSVELAKANKDIYPDLVQASRWGSVVLGVLLCAAGAFWAHRLAGPLAAWLAGLGLALNPNLLAHGNLATTDMGVTALVFCGCLGLWMFVREDRRRWMVVAVAGFGLAAVTKFSGLVWLAVFALVCVPALVVWRRRPGLLWVAPATLVFAAILVLILYGPAPQVIRVPGGSWWNGRVLPAGRFVEGILAQTEHVLGGHRAFFAGRQLTRSAWWMQPAALIVKTSLPWLAAFAFAVVAALRARRSAGFWIAVLPVLVYAAMLTGASKLALGVRHVLPVLPFLVVAAASAVGRLAGPRTRIACAALLLLSTLFTALAAFPGYISYYPLWVGGPGRGSRIMVDSSYDWGQELGMLERHWAALTRANGGAAPNLVYYGFEDPRAIYHMPVSPASVCGYMDWQQWTERPIEQLEAWKKTRAELQGTTAISISALRVQPLGMDFSDVEKGRFVGEIGRTILIYREQP